MTKWLCEGCKPVRSTARPRPCPNCCGYASRDTGDVPHGSDIRADGAES